MSPAASFHNGSSGDAHRFLLIRSKTSHNVVSKPAQFESSSDNLYTKLRWCSVNRFEWQLSSTRPKVGIRYRRDCSRKSRCSVSMRIADMTEANLLASALAESHPAEAAAMLENFGAAQSAEFLEELSPEFAAGVLQEMSGAHAAASVGTLTAESAASCMNGLPSAVAAAPCGGCARSAKARVSIGPGGCRRPRRPWPT